MANEVGHAFVSIVPSLRGFSSSMQTQLNRSGIDRTVSRNLSRGATPAGARAGDEFAHSFNSRARVGLTSRGGVFTGLATTLRGSAGLMVTALGAAGVAATTFGLKSASAMEQAQVAFTTMLGSAKQARDFLGELTDFAAHTPFDLVGVRTAAQQLLAFGFASKDVIPTLTAIGDASAGLGLGAEGLTRITTAIGQIQAKGKVQSDELLQLTESGIPALKILASTFGVTTAQMQDMVTKGLVPANKAIPALLSGIENGTKTTAKFGGLMEKQSRTLGGLFSNLKDSVTKGLGQAFTPIAHLLERNLPAVTTALDGAFGALRQGIRKMIPALNQAGPAVGGFLAILRDDVLPIAVHIARTVFPALRAAVADVAKAFRKHRDDFARLGSVLVKVGGWLARIFGAEFAAQLRLAGKMLGFVIDAAGYLARFLSGPFVRAVAKMVSFWARAVKFLADSFLGVVGVIVHAGSKAFGWLPKVGDDIKGAANAFDAFKDHIDSVLSGIATDAAGWGESAGTAYGENFKHAAAAGLAGNLNPAVAQGGVGGTSAPKQI
jgi:tape measure domain-containing protein